MKIFPFFLFLHQLNTYLFESNFSKTIKCSNNISLGSLSEKDYEKTNIKTIIKNFFKTNQTNIHYSKLEDSYDLISHEMHPFINAVHLAYVYHLNLIISPDMIWHLISSGTSIFINQNSNELRNVFVNHQSKKIISIRKDEFLFNSVNNQWDELIDEFVDKIQENVKLGAKNLFSSNFSTTTKVGSVVSKIVLMESMQKYFQFKVFSLCGIPEIKILGTKEDWIAIKSKLNILNQTIPDLYKWYDQLNDIIQEFINVYDDKVNYEFWDKIYKVSGGSGGPYLSGWIIVLFPFLKNNSDNYFVWEKQWTDAYNHFMYGLATSDFPMTLSKVPFKWDYHFKEFDMMFIGGLFGINYDQNAKSLKPVFGYAVIQL